MNKFLKLAVTAFICSLFLFFFIFNKAEHEKEAAISVDTDKVEEMIELEVEEQFLPFANSERRTKPISHVVLHFSSNVTENPTAPYEIEKIYKIFVDYGVSAHYLIDREGNILRLVTENRVAYHAGAGSLPDFTEYEDKLNDYSIGIELLAIGTKSEMAEYIDESTYDLLDPSFIGYTDEQYESLNILLDTLHEQYPEIIKDRKHVVGHDEYAPERKNDPGELFDWSRIGY